MCVAGWRSGLQPSEDESYLNGISWLHRGTGGNGGWKQYLPRKIMASPPECRGHVRLTVEGLPFLPKPVNFKNQSTLLYCIKALNFRLHRTEAQKGRQVNEVLVVERSEDVELRTGFSVRKSEDCL